MSSSVNPKPHLMIQIPEENPIELGSPLGSGTYGIVYKYNSPKGSALAVKLHRPGSKYVAASRKEAEMYKLIQGVSRYTIELRRDVTLGAMGIKGDAIVPPSEQHAIFLKRLSCPTFHQSFPTGTPTPFRCSDVFYYARQAAYELDIYHRVAKIIHRDLNRTNIAIDTNAKQIFFFDLGTADKIENIKRTDLKASRNYRAPESLFFLPYDATIDLWALGCLLYEFYTGNILFQSLGKDWTPCKTHMNSNVIAAHLYLMCFHLGLPPKGFIEKLKPKWRDTFFVQQSNGEYKVRTLVRAEDLVIPKMKWRDMIYHTAQVKGDSKGDADILIRLMESVLKYTGRIDAQGFLGLMDQIIQKPNTDEIKNQ